MNELSEMDRRKSNATLMLRGALQWTSYRKKKKSKKASPTSRDLGSSTSGKQDLVEEGVMVGVSLAKKGIKKAFGKTKGKDTGGSGEQFGYGMPGPLKGHCKHFKDPKTPSHSQHQHFTRPDSAPTGSDRGSSWTVDSSHVPGHQVGPQSSGVINTSTPFPITAISVMKGRRKVIARTPVTPTPIPTPTIQTESPGPPMMQRDIMIPWRREEWVNLDTGPGFEVIYCT
ncbi:hypothetical protein BKA64DRAFT_638129 [Cadophora sp. MPI-SDFR-AT-0126]|nr:hypothetical protein BKA64DRAFT_638129 [Leotiomycetes sp. MPI-SDFR-AT-0126]